jgi:hypothetical protein
MEPGDVLRIAGEGQTPFFAPKDCAKKRCQSRMDVVRHQTVSQHPHPVLLGLLTQQPQVRDTVPIHKEHVLAVILNKAVEGSSVSVTLQRLTGYAYRLDHLAGKGQTPFFAPKNCAKKGCQSRSTALSRVIPPVRDMVRQPRYDDARLSRHATRILELEGKANK